MEQTHRPDSEPRNGGWQACRAMCGVLFALSRVHADLLTFISGPYRLDGSTDVPYRFLQARGPDSFGQATVHLPNGSGACFAASLLQLRGSHPLATVPLTGLNGSVLLFNGEIFGGLAIGDSSNDGAALLQALDRSSSVFDVLSGLEGPWAVVYYCQAQQCIWFGRDALGRRSLLLSRESHKGLFLLSSIWLGPAAAAATAEQLELEPGIYSIDVAQPENSAQCWSTTRHPWDPAGLQARLSSYARDAALIAPAAHEPADAALAAQQALSLLQRAVCLQCASIQHPRRPACMPQATGDLVDRAAPVLILFSGGVDSSLIAALAHRALPADVPIDLCCVCFDQGRSPDRLAALDAVQELAAFAPTRCWRFIEVDATLADVQQHQEHLLELLRPSDTVMDLNIGAALWLAARAQGNMWLILPSSSQSALPEIRPLQPLVSPPYAAAACMPASSCPGANAEAQLGPTVSGDAVGNALNGIPKAEWRSQARVVLLGQGADEQCAGYGRHRTKFRERGWQGLQEEMALDVRRLWLRNLGRDDRLVSDHGRESRHPFLDEAFMRLLLGLPLPLIADLRLPSGVGDKLILRNMLRTLGLPRAAARPKRAIQFGSRIGKLANIRDFGSNRAANARNAGSVKLSELSQQD